MRFQAGNFYSGLLCRKSIFKIDNYSDNGALFRSVIANFELRIILDNFS